MSLAFIDLQEASSCEAARQHLVGSRATLFKNRFVATLVSALLLCAPALCQKPRDSSTWEVPGKYARRNNGRSKLKNKKVAEAISRGLEWLRLHQDKDGKWDAEKFMKHDKTGVACSGAGKKWHSCGMTGLALLCFLADGNSVSNGLYAPAVSSAVNWLASQADKQGRIGDTRHNSFIYEHSIAALALVEAYALSGGAELKKAAVIGIRYLQSHRNPGAAWRYWARDKQSDSSVTGWALIACHSARDVGIHVPAKLFREVDAWLLSITEKSSGHSGYQVVGEVSARLEESKAKFPASKTHSTTAITLFSRLLLGRRPKNEPLLHKQAQLINAKLPVWNETDGTLDMYYWYYASLAQRQMGEPYWSKWYDALCKSLVAAQRRDGNSAGSFDPIGVWGELGGRVYATCMCLLSLQAAYRYELLSVMTPFSADPVYRGVRKQWQDERYDRVSSFLLRQRSKKLGIGQYKVLQKAERVLQERIDAATAFIAALGPQTRFHAATKRLERIKRNFGSLATGKTAKAKLEYFRKNKAIARELKAGEELEKLRNRFKKAKRRQLTKLEILVEKLLDKYHDSQVTKDAKQLLLEIKAAIRG